MNRYWRRLYPQGRMPPFASFNFNVIYRFLHVIMLFYDSSFAGLHFFHFSTKILSPVSTKNID